MPSPDDHPAALFGAVAADYARFRLQYPPAFLGLFAARCPRRPGEPRPELVWDCGCGSGQAATALAEHVGAVIATDASAEQLAAAFPHPRVTYRRASAESSGLPAQSVDGVLVAAAVHWFAGEAFNAEVRRVARPGAVMAWIGYLPVRLPSPELQRWFERFYGQDLEPWWPPQRRWVDASYAGLDFPGREWPFPGGLVIERRWDLTAFLGHLGTWSAVGCARRNGHDPLIEAAGELREIWPGGGREPLPLQWPFMGRWGVIGGEAA
jgi:SAM-dependent methyltransferase